MKFPYKVEHNGINYEIGEDVPIEDTDTKPQNVPNKPSNDEVKEKVEEVVVEPKKAYTRTDINRMSTEDLRAFAMELGIKGAEDKNGTQLKKIIPEQLGI